MWTLTVKCTYCIVNCSSSCPLRAALGFTLNLKHFVRPADAQSCRFSLLVSYSSLSCSSWRLFENVYMVYAFISCLFPLHTVIHIQPQASMSYVRNKLWTIEITIPLVVWTILCLTMWASVLPLGGSCYL